MDDKKKEKKEENLEVPKGPKEPEEPNEEKEESAKEIEEHIFLQKVVEAEDKYKRALADYQNLQRRVKEEKSEWIRGANKELVLKMLPILDTLMLAEKHTKDQNFVLTVQQFLQVLEQEGFERIKALGETFDPLLMDVVETKQGEDWKVLEEVKPGFRLGDLIIRPAYVIVGKKGS